MCGAFFCWVQIQNKTKRNKIRSGGCDYELGDIGGHKKNQATSVSSGPCPRGVVICKDFAIFYAGRRCPAGGVVEKVKNKCKLWFNVFS